jgi:uncharacterized protein YbjT (DUF2867 family)
MSQPIVVTGATGHVGGRIADRLLAGEHDVRAVSRSGDRLSPLVDRGAEPRAGSVDDPAFLEELFAGAGAAFLMIPPRLEDQRAFQERVSEAYARALAGSDVTHVVNLSSVGAHVPEGTGPIVGLRHNEQRLDEVEGIHLLHLRPTFFMENYLLELGALELIREQGILGSPLRPELAMPQVATRDIGDVAARRLAARDFSGTSTRELLGPRAYDMEEAARILGDAVGKPDLPYVQFEYEGARSAMVGMGVPEETAESYLEMYRAFNSGLVQPEEERSAANTTPTTLETWAEEVFAPAYRAAERAGE